MRADAARRRQAIIDAACDVFRRVPAGEITLDDIACRAGVGIATLYRNFPTRHDLDVACGYYLLDGLRERILRLSREFDADPRGKWLDFVWGLVNDGIGTLVTVLAPEDPALIPAGVSAKREELIELMNGFLTQAERAGLVPPGLGSDKLAAELVVVCRPMSRSLSSLDPNVRDRLVQRLLYCWEHER